MRPLEAQFLNSIPCTCQPGGGQSPRLPPLCRQGFTGGSAVENLPAHQEMRVQSLSWDDPLEKEVATHSSFLAWEIPWTGYSLSGGLQSMGLQRVRHDWATERAHCTGGDSRSRPVTHTSPCRTARTVPRAEISCNIRLFHGSNGSPET